MGQGHASIKPAKESESGAQKGTSSSILSHNTVQYTSVPASSVSMASAGPVLSMGTAIQAEVATEEELQMQEAGEEEVQMQAEEEEEVQMQEAGEEEVQMQAEEEEEVQMQGTEEEEVQANAPRTLPGGAAHRVASEGVQNAATPLPGFGRIQAAFGKHDISNVRVNVGGEAAAANRQLGARAYARGNRIAFREQPSLRLSAHEAAHVVQQRRGVHLPGGLGSPGDAYEQQADRVAEAVVAGRSAEAELDRVVDGPPGGGIGVQRACSCGGTGCSACSEEKEEPVQYAPLASFAGLAIAAPRIGIGISIGSGSNLVAGGAAATGNRDSRMDEESGTETGEVEEETYRGDGAASNLDEIPVLDTAEATTEATAEEEGAEQAAETSEDADAQGGTSGEASVETTPGEASEEALDPEVVADIAATEAREQEAIAGVENRLDSASTEQQGPAASAPAQRAAAGGGARAASAATPSPDNEAAAMGQAAQVETMNEQEAGEVDDDSFLALVRQKLAEMDLPDNPKEMEEFKDNDGASGLREEVMGGVTEQTEGAQADIRGAAEAEPESAEERVPTPLEEESRPNVPDLRAESAVPEARSEVRVSQPLESNDTSATNRLEEAKGTHEHLDRPQDPAYSDVLTQKEAMAEHAEQETAQYRSEEEARLATERAQVAGQESQTAAAMEAAGDQSITSRGQDQAVAMTEEERVRQDISTQVESIFTRTQEDVQDKLDRLDEDVDGRFTRGEERAKNQFQDYVDDELFDWKLRRYGEAASVPLVGVALAAGTWLHDQWVGIANFPEVMAIFERGRERYVSEMETVIIDIGTQVDETLAWCQTRIEQGEEEIRTYVDSLPESQQQIAESVTEDISSRFDELRSTVENKRDELANRIAQRYQESRDALDAEIEAFQEENRGYREVFEEALDSVIDALESLEEMLPDLARRVPGYTLFTVIIQYNPLTGEAVERTPYTLIEGLMSLVPLGSFIFDVLHERGVLEEAFTWVEGELGRLNLTTERIEGAIEAAWEDIRIVEGLEYNLEVLNRHLGQLLTDVSEFALSLVDFLIDLIKRTALDIADDILSENQAWSLIKKVLKYDPLRDLPVDASTAEIIEDFLLLIGKEEELRQMQEQGTVQETADWIDTQLGTFLSLLTELGALFSDAWDAIQPENLPNLQSNLESLAENVGSFLLRAFDFALVVAEKVFEIIKNALLAWLQANANDIPGYHLLTVILGKDVFTEEPVPMTPTNLIRGFMSLVPGGEQQFQQLSESGVIPDAAARIEAAMSELGISWAFIRDLFLGIWDSLSIEDLADPLGAFERIINRFGEPLGRLIAFVGEVIIVVVELVLRMMGFPVDLIGNIIARVMEAVENITNDPVGFFLNLLAAMKLGFSGFFSNILTHLIGGLADWLFRGLRDAGVEPPADLSLASILDFVLDVLGISMERIWEKIAERIGPENVERIQNAYDRLVGIWNFVSDVQERGVVAIWEYIESQISNLWNMVLSKAQEWIMERIINRAIQWLLSLLDPSGIMPVINSCIAFFRAVQSAIEYLRDMLEIINDYVSTIAAISRGDVQPGADKMEQGLANAIPIAIGFLANQFGLGNIGEKMSEIIGGIREMIDAALDWLLDQAMRLWPAMLNALGLGGGDGEESDAEAGGEFVFFEEFTVNNEHHTISNRPGESTLTVASNNPVPLGQIEQQQVENAYLNYRTELAEVLAADIEEDERNIRKRNVINTHGPLILDAVRAWMAATSDGFPRNPAPGIGNIAQYGRQPSRLTESGIEVWAMQAEHILPVSFVNRTFQAAFAHLLDPGIRRGSSEDNEQHTIMIYKGAAGEKTTNDVVFIAIFRNRLRARFPGLGMARHLREDISEREGLVFDETTGQLMEAEEQDANERLDFAYEFFEEELPPIAADSARVTGQKVREENALNGDKRGPVNEPEPVTPTQQNIDYALSLQLDDILRQLQRRLDEGRE